LQKQSRTISDTATDETLIILKLLNVIHNSSAVTQRSVASELGIALGLANAYLKRCVKKGLVKVKQAPANRFAYYLTPKGFAEKGQLTARYLATSFDFFRHARTHCVDVFELCNTSDIKRIALVGASELAEIAILCVREFDIEIVGFIDQSFDQPTFSDLPVFNNLEEIGSIDAYVITDLSAPQETFEWLQHEVVGIRILAPQLLNISRSGIKELMP
jgi:DNA-binding MarR family transcriptional regulator